MIAIKVFSSLSESEGRDRFLQFLSGYIKGFMKDDAVLIYKDVNERSRGRDDFDTSISPLFTDVERYVFNHPGVYKDWSHTIIDINDLDNVFVNIPANISVQPKSNVMKEFVYVYKNKIIQGVNP